MLKERFFLSCKCTLIPCLIQVFKSNYSFKKQERKMGYLFTSESVSEGHPDKVADQISDAVLDKLLAYDDQSHVACETLVTTGQVIVAGEVKTRAYVDLQLI